MSARRHRGISRLTFHTATAALALLAFASCGRDQPTGPNAGASRSRIGLHLTFPQGAALADSLEFSVFSGSQRIAGPEVTLNSGSFSLALQVPSGSRRVAVVKAFGGSAVSANWNPGSGAILLGVSAPFSIGSGDTAEVAVSLQPFYTNFNSTDQTYTGSALISWPSVPGATRYTVRERVGETQTIVDRATTDTSMVIMADAFNTYRSFVVRAENVYALGGWSLPAYVTLFPVTSAGNWVVLNDGSGTAPGYRVLEMSAWSPILRVLYLFGGITDSTADNVVWRYSLAGNSWTALSAGVSGGPPPKQGGSMALSSDASMVYIFGGIDQDTLTNELDLWQYDVSARRWLLLGSTDLALRAGMVPEASFDAFLWMPAGSTTVLRLYVPSTSEVWTFDIGKRAWIAPSGPGEIPVRSVPAYAYSPASQSLFVYGGELSVTEAGVLDSTLWVYSEGSSGWSIAPVMAGAEAPARSWAGGAATSGGGGFLFMGGIASSFQPGMDDVWEYRPGAAAPGGWIVHPAGVNQSSPLRPSLLDDATTNRVVEYESASGIVRALDLLTVGAIDVRR